MKLNAPSPEYDTWGERIAEDLEMQRQDAEDAFHDEALEQLHQSGALVDMLAHIADTAKELPDCGEEFFAAHPVMRLDFASARTRHFFAPVQTVLRGAVAECHIESSFVEGEVR